MEYDFRQFHHGDVRLAYVELGRGAPVVLVHGGGPTDLRTWGQQLEAFAERFRVIAYSQRYHYPNAWICDGSDINSATVHAADLAALIHGLQLGRAHLVGISSGADIALRAAVEYPDLVRTLVVAEPALFSWLDRLHGGPDLFRAYAQSMIPAKAAVLNGNMEQGARLFIDAVMGGGFFDRLPPSLRGRLMDNVRLIGAEVTDLSEADPDITRDEAASIQAPTLVLTGDDSPKMFTMVSRELARHLPNVEQAGISRASHLLHVMNPEDYNATVLAFLGRHTG